MKLRLSRYGPIDEQINLDKCGPIGYEKKIKVVKVPQPAGFEPARAEPIGFRVQRLNHSATTASYM